MLARSVKGFRLYSTGNAKQFSKLNMSDTIKSSCNCTERKSKDKSDRVIGPIESAMITKIDNSLSPIELIIKNDSWKHSHHSAMKGVDNVVESHFNVTIVSEKFDKMTKLARHRSVFKLLDDEIKQIHGFQVNCKTLPEWEKQAKIKEEQRAERLSSSNYFN